MILFFVFSFNSIAYDVVSAITVLDFKQMFATANKFSGFQYDPKA